MMRLKTPGRASRDALGNRSDASKTIASADVSRERPTIRLRRNIFALSAYPESAVLRSGIEPNHAMRAVILIGRPFQSFLPAQCPTVTSHSLQLGRGTGGTMRCGDGYGRAWERVLSDWRRRQAPQYWWRGNVGGRRLDDARDPLVYPGRNSCHHLAGHAVASSSQGTVRFSTSSQGTKSRSIANSSNPLQDWAAKTSPAGQDIHAAVQSVQGAIGGDDVAGAKAASANERCKPTAERKAADSRCGADFRLSEVQGVVDKIGAHVQLCLAAGPNALQAEIESFTSQLHAATRPDYNRLLIVY
jgi:hypothetical protein